MSEEVKELRREVSSLTGAIGGLVSAGSLISLATKFFRVGLSPILNEFVDYYRKITHFFVDWLFFWTPIELPDWYKDAYVISFVLLALLMRSHVNVEHYGDDRKARLIFRAIAVVAAAIYSLILLGWCILPMAFYFAQAPLIDSAVARVSKAFRVSVFAMVLATIAFFALNSQL